ncbi:MAG: hypothetical protein ACI9EF_001621 [Pseudohongiellaceae bacterium]|jgi:hypothetical protein
MKPLHLVLALVALIAVAAVALMLYEPTSAAGPRVALIAAPDDEDQAGTSMTSPLADSTQRLNVTAVLAEPSVAEPETTIAMPASYRKTLGGIIGRLVEESGEPVVKMPITLLGGGGTDFFPAMDALLTTGESAIQPELGQVTTDDEGRFRFADIEPRVLGVLLIDPGGPRSLLHMLEETPVSGGEKDLGDIVMRLGVTLTGVVIDERGQGLPGVRVRATDLQTLILGSGIADFRAGGGVLIENDGISIVAIPPRWMERFEQTLPFPTTTTDGDGLWTLPSVPQGLISLVLDDNIHVSTVSGPHPTGDAGGTRDLGEVTMLDGLTLSGRVVDEADKPVPNAQVMAGNQLAFGPVAILRPPVQADGQGRFQVSGLRYGLARAAARRLPEHIFVTDTGGIEAESGEIVVVLPARRTLTLEVLDEDNEPIEQLRLFARNLPVPDSDQLPDFLIPPRQIADRVSQDPDGRWLVEDLDPGRWDVLIAAEGFGSQRNTFDLTFGDLTEKITLQPSSSVTVQLVKDDNEATPVEWAMVSVRKTAETDRREGPPQPLTASRSDDKGFAELSDLADGEYSVEVTHPSFAVTTSTITVPNPGEIPVIVLSAGGTVTGTVIENGGPPSQILLVSLRSEGGENLAGALPRTTLSALDGSFSFADVEPGDVQLQARERISFTSLTTWWEPFAMTPLSEQDVWVTSGQDTEATLIVGSTWADLETGFVKGRLLVNGQPAGGWKVRTWGTIRRSVTTSADGTFIMGHLEVGDVTLMFHSDASASIGTGSVDTTTFPLTLNEQRFVEVSLQTGAAQGRVLSGLNGQPVSGANVALKSVAQEGRSMWGGRGSRSVTDAMGNYRFDVVSEGDYTVSAEAEGFAQVNSEPFSVSRLGTARVGNVRLERAVSVSGLVVFEGTEETPSWMWLSASSDSGGQSNTRPDRDTLEFTCDNMLPNTAWTFTIVTSGDVDYEPVEVYVGQGRSDLELLFVPVVEDEEELSEEAEEGGASPFVYKVK